MHVSSRLPKEIELGAMRRDTMDLDIQIDDSGFEDINRNRSQFLCEYEVTYPMAGRSSANLLTVRNAFRATGGGEHSFELWDWADYSVEDQGFGEGDGTEDSFQLVKTYSFGGLTHSRIIHRPVLDSGEVESLTFEIQADGSPVSSSAYEVSDLGIVTFDTPPLLGVLLTWTGEFNVPVRFDKVIQSAGVTTDHEKYDAFLLVEKRLKASDFA